MPANRTELAPPRRSPPDLTALMGPPPLIDGEDGGAFEALYRRIDEAVAPRDALEEIWVRDIVDNLWETLRLRRIKSNLMRSSAHEGLERVITPLTELYVRSDLVKGWARREPQTVKEVEKLIDKAGLAPDAIAAETLAANLETFDRIDVMITRAEARRNTILREIERRREVLARRLREAAEAIEGALSCQLPAPKAAE